MQLLEGSGSGDLDPLHRNAICLQLPALIPNDFELIISREGG
jgi:hypothetical protein